MADGQQSPAEAAHTNLVQEQLIKTAHEQVAQAMDQAMAELPSRLSPQKDSESVSERKVEEMETAKQQNQPRPNPISVPIDDIEYVQPMQDPYGRAIKYLEQHNVMQMFQQLTASIVFNKPDKPLDFMMGEVERMKKIRDTEKQKTS